MLSVTKVTLDVPSSGNCKRQNLTKCAETSKSINSCLSLQTRKMVLAHSV
jgi:hypothetical protein